MTPPLVLNENNEVLLHQILVRASKTVKLATPGPISQQSMATAKLGCARRSHDHENYFHHEAIWWLSLLKGFVKGTGQRFRERRPPAPEGCGRPFRAFCACPKKLAG
jgi:hypothetical protein